MNLDESLREIVNEFQCIDGYVPPEAEAEFIAKIKALVVESLPKEQDISKGYPDSFPYKDGYNQCLGEIRSIFE